MATILIIDDDPDAQSILRTFLGSRGHEVHGASGGEMGLGKLADVGPDLVILDVMMPGMDGWEVARRIRRDPDHADVRILMLTARDGRDARAEGADAGVDDYVVKPVGLEELEHRIDAMIPPERRSERAG
ncbi:MAG: response regulator [Longimicrobiales bacterium]|nr:response regulator [Longimicrobiales bacterium]